VGCQDGNTALPQNERRAFEDAELFNNLAHC
jgi:hypothetical protein